MTEYEFPCVQPLCSGTADEIGSFCPDCQEEYSDSLLAQQELYDLEGDEW